MYSFIPYLVVISLVCLVIDLLCWRPDGIMRHQLDSMFDFKNERAFGSDVSHLNIVHILLIFQWCLFFGLILFTYEDEDSFENLLHPDLETWLELGICIAIPAAWLLIQGLLYHWWSYLFGMSGKAIILTRVYRVIHMLAAPMALFVFMMEVAGILSPENGWILLLLIFIIVQIVFIFSGIRIFWSGIGTLCFIFLYLCAFKIAPLLLLLAKLG